jgi:hypothetical protein
MGYLSDYLYYGSGNECPHSFQTWSALTLLGAVLGRKVWTWHGSYFKVHPNIYTCMVGTAGSGKSTAKGVAKEIFIQHFPDLLISTSIQSREDIAQKMGLPECIVTWKDDHGSFGQPGKIYEYRPFFAIVNELASFLSVDKQRMIEFLVDIFDENHFSTGFKTTTSQNFDNPCFSMLACAVPKWFMSNLKIDLFDGGLGRRMIIVYDEKTRLIDDPVTPPGGNEALLRAVDHLRAAAKLYGEVKKTEAAKKWWKEWYCDPHRINRDDPILMQFHETKHIILLKVAILLAMSEQPFTMTMTDDHMQTACAMLDLLEPKIVRLTSGIGRNELAGIGAQLLDTLSRIGGVASEKQLMKFFARYLRDPEFLEVVNHYITTNELVVTIIKDTGQKVYFLPDRYEEHLRKNAVAPVPAVVPPSTTSAGASASPSGQGPSHTASSP